MKKIPARIDDKDIIAEWDWLSDSYIEDNVGSSYTGLFFDNHTPWVMDYIWGGNIVTLSQVGPVFDKRSFESVKKKFYATNEDTDSHGVTAEIITFGDNTMSVSFWHIVED